MQQYSLFLQANFFNRKLPANARFRSSFVWGGAFPPQTKLVCWNRMFAGSLFRHSERL